MKRHLFGTLGAIVTVLVINGCAEDPTAVLRGDVVAVQISRTYIELDVGGTLQMEAWSLDEQGNRLGILPDIASSDPTTVSVVVDTDVSGDPLPRTRFSISADGVGSATLMATAGGVSSDPSTVISFPLVFDGAISVDQSGPQDIVTIAGTAALTFDDQTTVFLGGADAHVLSVASDQIQAVVLNEDALSGGSVRLNNLLFLGSIRSSLDATSTVDTRSAPFASQFSAAGDITAGPYPMTLYVRLDHDNTPDWFAKFDTPTDLDVTVTMSWPTGDDIDILWYDDTGACCYFNFDGATGANPEVSSATIPAGFPILLNANSFGGEIAVVRVDITSP